MQSLTLLVGLTFIGIPLVSQPAMAGDCDPAQQICIAFNAFLNDGTAIADGIFPNRASDQLGAAYELDQTDLKVEVAPGSLEVRAVVGGRSPTLIGTLATPITENNAGAQLELKLADGVTLSIQNSSEVRLRCTQGKIGSWWLHQKYNLLTMLFHSDVERVTVTVPSEQYVGIVASTPAPFGCPKTP